MHSAVCRPTQTVPCAEDRTLFQMYRSRLWAQQRDDTDSAPSLWLLLYIPIIWMCKTWCDKNPLLMCIKRMEQRQKMLLFKLLSLLLLLLLLSSFVKKKTKKTCWSIRHTSADFSPSRARTSLRWGLEVLDKLFLIVVEAIDFLNFESCMAVSWVYKMKFGNWTEIIKQKKEDKIQSCWSSFCVVNVFYYYSTGTTCKTKGMFPCCVKRISSNV